MSQPFNGAITKFYKKEAPKRVRQQISKSKKSQIANPEYPYKTRWDKEEYETALKATHIELVKLQQHLKKTDERVAIVFEGRDAAGKGGTIKRFREFLNPRRAKVVALTKPSEIESTQWYFQRYIHHLPAGGQIVLFDRSWYNRGVVESVFGFCTPEQRQNWFEQVNPFEEMLVNEGIKLFKIWLNVGQAEQLRRFLRRESDPLRQWKLSDIDVEGLKRWDEYSSAIGETLALTHTIQAPWTVIMSDDKRRARVNAIRTVLSQIDYAGKDEKNLGKVDASIVGTPDIRHG